MQRIAYKHDDTFKEAVSGLKNATLLDFWTWAFGDLCDDGLKGYFAEWIVMKLLGIASSRRIGWADSDLITEDEVRIEVKASSYWQSWKLLDEFGVMRPTPLHPVTDATRIAFAGLKARGGDGAVDAAKQRLFKSHIYVFALQKEKEVEKWNAMDLSQWEFYVLPRKAVQALGTGSISLKKLKSLQAPLSPLAFIDAAKKLIAEARSEIQIEGHSNT